MKKKIFSPSYKKGSSAPVIKLAVSLCLIIFTVFCVLPQSYSIADKTENLLTAISHTNEEYVIQNISAVKKEENTTEETTTPFVNEEEKNSSLYSTPPDILLMQEEYIEVFSQFEAKGKFLRNPCQQRGQRIYWAMLQ